MQATENADVEKAKAERERVRQRIARLSKQLRELREADHTLGDKIHRLKVKSVVGQQVRLRYRRPAGDRCAVLNDQQGTLLDARVTRGTIDFGQHGKWTFPLDEILAPDEEQGLKITM